jgi:glycosyltransferase involved in cell wall biosynthesis
MGRLLFVQPYVPEYRLSFFEQLAIGLEEFGIEMALAVGAPRGDSGNRSDDVSGQIAKYFLEEKYLSLGSRQAIYRSLRGTLNDFQPSMIVAEQAIKNLELYSILARRMLKGNPSLALWGQGRSYSTSQSSLAAGLKQWLTQRTDWFFSYTESGAEYVSSRGFDRTRITVVQNSIDTNSLKADIASVSEVDIRNFAVVNRVTFGSTGIFLGGVDDKKGISFLLEAVEIIRGAIPDFNLLVGGAGSRVKDVQKLESEGGPIRYLGRLLDHDKAVALTFADLLLIPQWVGLVAVDSLVAGVPIVTTNHASHSPEVQYLVDGRNSFFTQHSPSDYAETIISLLKDRDRLDRVMACARQDGEKFSIERMVSNFLTGVIEWQSSA